MGRTVLLWAVTGIRIFSGRVVKSITCGVQIPHFAPTVTHVRRLPRHHRHRRVPPLHLQTLAPDARILRRLAHRPHRHAVEADDGLLSAEPHHGVPFRPGRSRRINVDSDLYTTRTLISEHASTTYSGYQLGCRDRLFTD